MIGPVKCICRIANQVEGTLKRTSGNLLSLLRAQNKVISAALQMLLTGV